MSMKPVDAPACGRTRAFTMVSIRSAFSPDAPWEDGHTGEGSGSYRRVLVPIDSPGSFSCASAVAAGIRHPVEGAVRFVHVRISDPPARGGERFYPETREEAASVVGAALSAARAGDVEATCNVVEAERSRVVAAILSEAAAWGSDAIVLTQRRRRSLSLAPLGRVNRQVMHRATCPVVVVFPGGDDDRCISAPPASGRSRSVTRALGESCPCPRLTTLSRGLPAARGQAPMVPVGEPAACSTA